MPTAVSPLAGKPPVAPAASGCTTWFAIGRGGVGSLGERVRAVVGEAEDVVGLGFGGGGVLEGLRGEDAHLERAAGEEGELAAGAGDGAQAGVLRIDLVAIEGGDGG